MAAQVSPSVNGKKLKMSQARLVNELSPVISVLNLADLYASNFGIKSL